MDRFSLIIEYKLLQENNVEKMYPLKPGPLPTSDIQNVVFICRPLQSLMDTIANVVQCEQEKKYNSSPDFHIFFVPWKSFLCTQKLEVR